MERVLLKDIVDIHIGHQSRDRIEPHPHPDARLLQIKDVGEDRTIAPDDLIGILSGKAGTPAMLRQDDVLFLARGHRNFAFTPVVEREDILPAYYFFILRIRRPGLLPAYLAWYLNQAPAQQFLHSQAKRGSHMPIVPKSALEEMPVEIPPVGVQEIVVELERLNKQEQAIMRRIMEMRDRLIQVASLEALKKSTTLGEG